MKGDTCKVCASQCLVHHSITDNGIPQQYSRQHTTCIQPLEQLLMGWTVGGMLTLGDDNGEEHHHHCCEHLLAGWMGVAINGDDA
jgi:hypothetical protein